jgi:hypothetical protein
MDRRSESVMYPVGRYQVVAWRRALTAAAAAWLVAAGCREREREPAGEPEAESAQASTETPVLAPDRLGPLDGRAVVDRASLARAFPGLRVESARGRFRVLRGPDELFTVKPADDGRVSSIEIVSRQVATTAGGKVGDLFDEVRRAAGPLECNGGVDHLAGEVLCTPRRARSLTFAFPVADRRFAGDDVPADQQARFLAGRRVRRILWVPPA